jgi:hypothetical protein
MIDRRRHHSDLAAKKIVKKKEIARHIVAWTHPSFSSSLVEMTPGSRPAPPSSVFPWQRELGWSEKDSMPRTVALRRRGTSVELLAAASGRETSVVQPSLPCPVVRLQIRGFYQSLFFLVSIHLFSSPSQRFMDIITISLPPPPHHFSYQVDLQCGVTLLCEAYDVC